MDWLLALVIAWPFLAVVLAVLVGRRFDRRGEDPRPGYIPLDHRRLP